jgi:hypothetical protein
MAHGVIQIELMNGRQSWTSVTASDYRCVESRRPRERGNAIFPLAEGNSFRRYRYNPPFFAKMT